MVAAPSVVSDLLSNGAMDFSIGDGVHLSTALILGGIGGLFHWLAMSDASQTAADRQRPLNAMLVGLVAATGALWLTPPATLLVCVAQSLLTGFFGEALLATLQARITAGIAADRLSQVANEARSALATAASADAAKLDKPTVQPIHAALNNIIALASSPRVAK